MSLLDHDWEEIITEEELKELLESDEELIAYDGFEPSGRIHIAQAIIRAININKLTKEGIKFKMLVADWHGWANNKMGGDLDKIQTTGKYMIEVWKAAGMDMDNVEFVWASDLVKDDNYWKLVMEIARSATLNRVIRCSQIMGRKEDEALQASQILYPCMQAADIFYLNAKICQLGHDQRKVNMLARELGPKLGYFKPVSLSHHMLMGLSEPYHKVEDDIEDIKKAIEEKDAEKLSSFRLFSNQKFMTKNLSNQLKSVKKKLKKGETDKEFIKLLKKRLKEYEEERQLSLKMSKSKPDTAIFMDDAREDIDRKINKAYCPEGEVEENPLMEYAKYMIFERFDKFVIERPEKFGGNLEFSSYEKLAESFANNELHPMDLKKAIAEYIDKMIEPVRKHFRENEEAKRLLEKIRGFQVTR
ncbi:MAG: tyrosine--tRNA ligase [Nanobdellota archaeon]